MSNNQIFIASGRAITTVSDSDNSIFGSNATTDEVVKITDAAATNIIVDANVERVQFTGAIADYKYLVVGTNLKIYNAAGTLVSTIGVQADETTVQLAAGAKLGTQLTFANGTVDAKITGLNAVTLGDQAVSATTAAAVVIPTAKIDATLASAPIPVFSVAGAASATEGGNALFTVTLANPSATTATTVKYALSNLGSTTSADYGTAVTAGTNVTDAAGTLTFAAGATTATVTVPVTFDSAIETGEGVTLTLSAPSAGTVSSTGAAVTTAFADAPAPTFTMTSSATAGISVQEGNTITFTVTPSGIVNAATVLNLNVVGAALGAISATTSATDFTTASAITFAAGETAAKTITVTVVNDGTTEGIEAYKAQLLDSSYNEKAAIQGTVTDATPTVTLTAAAASVDEGKALVFTATSDMVAPAGGLVVPVTFGGTATTADYTTTATSITIAAGQLTGTLSLNAIADNATEGAETVTATLGNVNGATTVTTPVTVTINDTSLALAANAFSLSGAATADEGTSVVYTITRGAATTVATNVPYTITGTATSGADYTAQTGTATFAIGATTATITLPIIADLKTEGSETVIVTLGTPSVSTDVVTAGAGTVTTTIADTSTTAVVAAFTLTPTGNTSTNGVDNVTGSAYNSINALLDYTANSSATTWQLTDTIAPSASANASLNVTILNGGLSPSAVGFTSSNVATVNVRVLDTVATANTTTFDASSLVGLTTLNVASSSTIATSTTADTVVLNSLPAGAKLGVTNNGQYTNVTGNWIAAATSGSADTVALALEGRNGTISVLGATGGFETAAITTTGTGNRETGLTTNAYTNFKTITVAGTDFRVDTALDATVTSFSAATASGVINVALAPTSTFSAIGGTGTSDVIQLAGTTGTPTISAFEKVVAGTAGTFDLTNVTGNTVLGVAVNAGNVAFSNVLATQNTLAFSSNYNVARATDLAGTGSLTSGGTVGYTLKTATGSADTLAVTVDNGGTTTTGTYTVGGLVTATAEIINLNVSDWKAVTVTTGITQTVTAAAASSLTVGATSANLTLGTLTSSDLTGGVTYNFSAVAPTAAAPTTTGAVTVTTAAATGALTYTGSQGVDTVTNTVQTATTGTVKTQTFNLGAGNDAMTIALPGATITDKLVISGEAGDDTFTVATTAAVQGTAATVTIDGGAGTNDALVLTGTVANGPTATIAGIEKINFQNGTNPATTALTVAAGYADSVLLTDVSGQNETLNITSAGNVDVSGWTQLGWTNSAVGAAADVLSITGSGTLKASTTIATAVTGGSAVDTITTAGAAATVTGGASADAITLGASNGVVDVIVTTGGMTTVDTVANFTGASDVVQVDRSEAVTINGGTVGLLQGTVKASALAATVAVSGATLLTVTAATTPTAASLIIIDHATAWTATTLARALEIGGGVALTTNGTFAANDGFLIAYDDNANTYLAVVKSAAGASSTTFTANDLTVTPYLQITGMASATSFTTADFQLVA